MAETLDQFTAQLIAAGNGIDAAAEGAVARVGEMVAETARGFVKVRSGATRDSIRSDLVEDEKATAEIGPTTVAGPMLERGTATMPAFPFLDPAIEEQAPTLEALLGQAGLHAIAT